MFWAIVGALVFFFYVIPLSIRLFSQGLTWRILCSILGAVIVASVIIVHYEENVTGGWIVITEVLIGLIGFYLFFLGIIGSFSPNAWKEFWDGPIPSWFGGERQQWEEFYKWNKKTFHHFYDLDSSGVSDEIPSWFGGDTEQWVKFQKWFKYYIHEYSHGLQKNNNAMPNKTPVWFSGDEQQWIECDVWYAEFVKESIDASSKQQLKNLETSSDEWGVIENKPKSEKMSIISWIVLVGGITGIIILSQYPTQKESESTSTPLTSKTDFIKNRTPVSQTVQEIHNS